MIQEDTFFVPAYMDIPNIGGICREELYTFLSSCRASDNGHGPIPPIKQNLYFGFNILIALHIIF